MATMQEIQIQTEEYAEARKVLEARVKKLQGLKDRLDKRYMPGITRALLVLVQAKDELKNLISGARALFEKPKTQIFAGVKVGFKKGKGKLTWDDDAKLIAKIRKTYGDDKAESLIRVEEYPSKEALELLPADELKKLGVTVQEAGDLPYIKDTESEIEKIIKALMKSEEEEQAEAAA